jgi:hypothetical protein
MDLHLNLDIVTHILKYLSKDESFNFLNVASFMEPSRKILYGKYLFDHDKVPISHKKYIKKVKCKYLQGIQFYENLVYLGIYNNDFDYPIDNLPESLKTLNIVSSCFNQPLDNLPKNLLHLKTYGVYYNQIIKNLPEKLETLEIRSYKFNQPLDNLPNSLAILKMDCENFNHPLDSLPNNMQSLSIVSNSFNQMVNSLPKTLKGLEIGSPLFANSIDYLPNTLRILVINSKNFNQNISHSQSLEQLFIRSDSFNKPLDNVAKSLQVYYITGKDKIEFTNLPKNVVPNGCPLR